MLTEEKVDKTWARLEYSQQSMRHIAQQTSKQSAAKAIMLLDVWTYETKFCTLLSPNFFTSPWSVWMTEVRKCKIHCIKTAEKKIN